MRARRVLILADQTADSRELVVTIERLANVSPCAFTVLVPVRARGAIAASAPGSLPCPGQRRGLTGCCRSYREPPETRSSAWSDARSR
jgi:hypothetical protein